jgi:hypothetical protein
MITKKIFVKEDNKEVWENFLNHIFPPDQYKLIWEDSDLYNDLNNIDLIICDYFLKDTLEVKYGDDWLKENVLSKVPDIPVVFWTSSMDPHVIKSTIIGSEIFFKKELNINEFKQTVDRLIEEKRINKQFPLYNSFFNQKIRDERKRKVLYAIYLNASRLLESFFGQSKFHAVFNAHGLIHIQRVIDNLGKLLNYCIAHNKDYFTEDHYFVVYLSAILHDLGMILDIYEENIEFEKFRKIRNNHCLRIFSWLYSKEILKKLDLNEVEEIKNFFDNNKAILIYVAFITLYHDCHFEFSKFPLNEHEELQQIINNSGFIETFFNPNENDWKKYKILAGLLALADKLDYGKTRTPVMPIRDSNLRGMRDEFEYIKNELIEGYEILYSESQKYIISIIIDGPEAESTSKSYFNDFLLNGFNNEGQISKTGLISIVFDLQKELTQSWNNIKSAFENTDNEFLSKLDFTIINTNNKNKEPKKITLPQNNPGIMGCDNLELQEKAIIYFIFPPDKYKSLRLEKVSEGFSGAKIFYVRDIYLKSYDGQNDYFKGQGKFLKIDKYSNIHYEVLNYKKIAIAYLPPKSTIGHVEEFKYLDYGAYIGSILEDDNNSIINLENHIKKYPSTVIESSENILNIYYQNIKPVKVDANSIYEFYNNLIQKKKEKIPKEKRTEIDVLNYQYLIKFENLLKQIKTKNLEFYNSIIHGDFTFRNILMSSGKYVFIDFAESGWGHYFFDFAKLDHYLRFEFLKKYEGCYVDLEEKIWNNERFKYEYDSVHSIIWQNCRSRINIEERMFLIQKYLASLYMHIWSIPFKDDSINTSRNERIALSEFYFNLLNKNLIKR